MMARESSMGLKNIQWSGTKSIGPAGQTVVCDKTPSRFVDRLQFLSSYVSSVNESSERETEVIIFLFGRSGI